MRDYVKRPVKYRFNKMIMKPDIPGMYQIAFSDW